MVELRFASQVRLPKTLHLNRRPGRIRRIRGVAYCTGVSASHNARMIQAARGVLNSLVSDVHIAAQYDPAPLVGDIKAGGKRKIGIGFGLSLVAESSADGVLYSADVLLGGRLEGHGLGGGLGLFGVVVGLGLEELGDHVGARDD